MSLIVRYRLLFFVFISAIYGYWFLAWPSLTSGLVDYLKSQWLPLMGYAQFILAPFFFVQMGINMPATDNENA